jgi:hypothetical protein
MQTLKKIGTYFGQLQLKTEFTSQFRLFLTIAIVENVSSDWVLK